MTVLILPLYDIILMEAWITFSKDGRQTIEFGDRNQEAYSVAIQNDGKIVVAGNLGSYATR